MPRPDGLRLDRRLRPWPAQAAEAADARDDGAGLGAGPGEGVALLRGGEAGDRVGVEAERSRRSRCVDLTVGRQEATEGIGSQLDDSRAPGGQRRQGEEASVARDRGCGRQKVCVEAGFAAPVRDVVGGLLDIEAVDLRQPDVAQVVDIEVGVDRVARSTTHAGPPSSHSR